MSTEQERKSVEWTYMGQRLTASKKLAHAWRREDGEQVLYLKLKAASVGGVYALDVSPNGEKVFSASLRFVRQSDDENAPRWSIEHESARVEYDAQRAEKSAAKEKPLSDMTLREVKQMMHRTLAPRRRALLAVILKEIGA